MAVVLLVVGLALLVIGAEFLVKGASRLAVRAGISPLVIGLTIVAFGTSAPELAVSVGASLNGQADLALGNVVGSNIFNILLILGLSALVVPLVVSRQLVRLDVPLMIAASFLVLVLGLDGVITRLDGALLFSGILIYTAVLIRGSRAEAAAAAVDAELVQHGNASSGIADHVRNGLYIIGGLLLLVWGARWLVDGAITLAEALGLSELVIGLTIVAAGTSMPELATSVVASFRGERDIAVGNVVGSNIFNILSVLGFSSLVSPAGIQVSHAALIFDIPVMIGVALLCLPIFFTGYIISRTNGMLLIFFYLAYTAYLILGVTGHPGAPMLASIMLWCVIPVAVLVLLVLMGRYWWGLRPKT